MSAGRWFLHGVLTVCLVGPVWAFTYFPTQDGAAYVYDAKLMREYSDPANRVVHEHYKPDPFYKTHFTSEWMLARLQGRLGADASEKILITICLALFAAGAAFMFRSIHDGYHDAEWLGYPLAYSHLMFMGFYDFILGTGLAFLLIGWWWPRRATRVFWTRAVYGLGCATLFVTHIYPLFAVLMLLGLYEAYRWIAFRIKNPIAGIWVGVPWFSAGICVLFGILTLLQIPPGEGGRQAGLGYLGRYLFGADFLDALAATEMRLVGTIFIIWFFFRFYSNLRRPWPEWRADADRVIFLAIALLFLAIYGLGDWGRHSGGRHYAAFLNERAALLFILFAAAWCSRTRVRFLAALSLVVITGITFFVVGEKTREIRKIQQDYRELVSGVPLIRPHSTYRFISDDMESSKNLTGPFVTEIFSKGVYRYALEQPDIVFLGNVGEPSALGSLHYDWPLHYQLKNLDTRQPADYLISWKTRPERLQAASAGYQTIFVNGDLRLLKRESAPLFGRSDRRPVSVDL